MVHDERDAIVSGGGWNFQADGRTFLTRYDIAGVGRGTYEVLQNEMCYRVGEHQTCLAVFRSGIGEILVIDLRTHSAPTRMIVSHAPPLRN